MVVVLVCERVILDGDDGEVLESGAAGSGAAGQEDGALDLELEARELREATTTRLPCLVVAMVCCCQWV